MDDLESHSIKRKSLRNLRGTDLKENAGALSGIYPYSNCLNGFKNKVLTD